MILVLRNLVVAAFIVPIVATITPGWAADGPGNALAANVAPISIEDADRALRASMPERAEASAPLAQASSQPVARSAAQAVGQASCSPSGPQPVEIIALAAGLKCDPDLIFEYVYNNIEYEPLFGSNKGALGTLFDQRGNDIDQVNLFMALLTAAGVPASQINLQYGYIRVTSATAPGWLGVSNDTLAIGQLVATAGIPNANFYTYPDGTFSIDVAHVWVQLQINGTAYAFDPSFKQHTITTGLSNLALVLGYTPSQFLADAGGSLTATSFAGVNRGNVRRNLLTYANNLAAYIKTNGPAWSLSDVVGGKKIVYLTGSPLRQASLPYLSPSQPSGFPQNWGAAVPNNYRTCFTISMPGVAPTNCANWSAGSPTIQLYSDTVYGHRITVFSSSTDRVNFTPTLLIDGVGPPNGQNTGTIQPASQPWAINVAITHPFASPSLGSANESGVLSVRPGGSYLISNGWGQVGRGMVVKHRTFLMQAAASGAAGGSEPVLGEALATIGFGWLAQNASTQRLLGSSNKTSQIYYHGLGIVGQTAIQGQSSTQGPYVDLPFNYVGVVPQTFQGSGFTPLLLGTFTADSGMSSSFEAGVLEQTQGLVPGMTAASTIRLIDQNIASEGTTYFADGTTAGGVSAYFASIRPNLALYSAGDLASIDNAVSTNGTDTGGPAGNLVLLPANGMQNVGLWKGVGYTIINSNTQSITQRISGGLSGGFSGTDVPTTVPFGSSAPTIGSSTAMSTGLPSGAFGGNAAANPLGYGLGDVLVAEPVDGITGTYLYNNTDLAAGNGSVPYTLAFGRSYSSASNMVDVGIGKGWTHSFSISAFRASDPYAGLGEDSATNSASAIAALYVMQDLLTSSRNLQNLTLSWLACKWLTDQLTNNSVLVSQPATNEQFIAAPRPDGAVTTNYVAPLGSGAVVTGSTPDAYGNPTVFSYVGKDQRRLTFNPVDVTNTGSIATFTQPNGTSLSFAYGYTNAGLNYLTQVSSNLGRSLFLSWAGPHLASVADGLGRSVSYGYDASGNLASEADPLGNVTRFFYDQASRLLEIHYPAQPGTAMVTNTYDGLGRVNTQANANGNVTSFYIAGARTETVDPAGGRHVTYQSGSGKVLADIGVFDNAIGNVFNDAPQQAGLVVARNQYDGQDRLSVATSPEGGTTTYAYSPDFRQNLVRVTVTPKPGSGLGPLITSWTYDPLYNKPTSVTDPLGLVMSMAYDPSTGNLVRMVRDAGAAPHFNSTTSFTYDARGLLLTSTDPAGVVTRYAYDGAGNPTSVVHDAAGLGITARMGYDAIGNLTSMTDPRGSTSTSTYDATRQQLTTTGPATGPYPGSVTTNTFDLNGNPTGSRQVSAGLVAGTAQTFTATGKVATRTDANGNVTRYRYDAVDRLASVTDAVGRVTLYGYDALGRQTTLANPAIQAAPLLTRRYTPDGLVASLTDANGNVLNYAYDGFDRLALTTYPATAAFGSTTEGLTYDADGNVRTRTTRRGDTITFGYDTLNRLTSKTEPAGTPSVTYAYDMAGRVVSVSDNGAAISAATQATSLVTTASYDALNHPVLVGWSPVAAQAPPGSPSTVGFSHRYDATNRRIGQVASDSTWLTSPGPVTSTTYAANALNQYSRVGGATPAYDATGNLTSDGTFTYGYDAENRLVSVAQGGSAVASYTYDGRGRRRSRTAGGVTTIYVTGAEDQDVAEYNGATGVPNAFYTFNPAGGLDDVLNRAVPGGARQTLVPDIQGSIIASLDSGGALARVSYQPFGESASAVASGAGPRYTGRRLDPETAVASGAQPSGLYYYRARTYSPTLGRFLQADPAGIAGGVNLYAYAGNNSLNSADPFGLAETPQRSSEPGPSLLGNGSALAFGATIGCGIAEPCGAAQAIIATVIVGGVVLLNSDQQSAINARESQNPDYTYQTYTRFNPSTGQTYVGRTSGPNDPLTNLINRYSGVDSRAGFGPAQLDQSSNSYSAIRGREQDLINAYGGVGSGRLANAINGISILNPLGSYYLYRSMQEFGPASPR